MCFSLVRKRILFVKRINVTKNNDSFTGITEIHNITVNGHIYFGVRLGSNLSVGTHITVITITGENGIYATFSVEIELLSRIALSTTGPVYLQMIAGGEPASYLVRIDNISNLNVNQLSVFENGINRHSLSNIPSGGHIYWMISVPRSISIGTHVIQLTLRSASAGVDITLTAIIEVLPADIEGMNFTINSFNANNVLPAFYVSVLKSAKIDYCSYSLYKN